MRPRFSCVLLLLLVPGAAGAGETGGRLRLQVGHEYDTNALRICLPPFPSDPSRPPPPDGVLRVILEGGLDYTSGRHSLAMSFLGGTKVFFHQHDEDLTAVKLSGSYDLKLSEKLVLGGRLIGRDTTLRYHDRDYTLVRGDAFLQARLSSWLALEPFFGGRYYYFKPDAYDIYALKYTHYGPVAGLRLRMTGEQVSSMIFYQIDARLVDDRSRNTSFTQTSRDRFDLRHTGGLRVKHPIRYWGQRRLILEMSYMLSVNDSNSFGSSALWHRLQLVVSMHLPLDINLHLMGTLQFTDYLDNISADGSLYEPDADENENSLVVRIGYPLWKGLSLILHGAIYRNAFHSGTNEKIPFARETIMLGLAYDHSF